MARLELKDISKQHGNKIIIDKLNLAINKGEFIVIVGPSGCGKSTLLRLIAGLEELTQGEIILNDKDITEMQPKDRNMAMVFQNYALYPHMDVYDNMAYGLRRRGMNKREIEHRIQETAKILEINELLNRKPQQLSGGQRQRVAMGRAIVRRPVLYLFDEPLSNLDAKLRIQMRLEIKKLHKNFAITSLYVTHDQMEAMTLADRLVVLNHGKIEQIGAPLEIYRNPATVFVASFIGSPPMNFLEGTITSDGTQLMFTNNKFLTLEKTVPSLYWGKNVLAGIRPEDILISQQENGFSFSFQVNLWELLGAETVLYGTIENGKLFTVCLSHAFAISEPTNLIISFTAKNLHLFDKETQQRIVA